MKIRTQSEKLSTLRARVMELYASDHPAELLNGSPLRTEIRDMAHQLGVTGETRYGYDGERHTNIAKMRATLFHLRSQCLHRLFALRSRLR